MSMTYAEWTEVWMQVEYERELRKLHNFCQMSIDRIEESRKKKNADVRKSHTANSENVRN